MHIPHDVKDIERFFLEYDPDGNGELDIDEFLDMMTGKGANILQKVVKETAEAKHGESRFMKKAKNMFRAKAARSLTNVSAVKDTKMKMNYSYTVS